MKHKNVQVGQNVIIKRSTSADWLMAADHIGEEFRVVEVEPLDYCGGDTEGRATVLVSSVIEEGPFKAEFWCNHRDLKLVKEAPERPFKVGDKVRVINNPDDLFPVGTIGTVTSDDGAERDLPFLVETADDYWHYHERDLELYVEEVAEPEAKGPEIGALFVVTGCTTPSHCFSDGTVVRCVADPRCDGGNYRYENKYGGWQYISPSDLAPLSLADIQEALARPAQASELTWPWPKGTPVDLTEDGQEYATRYLRYNGLPLDTPLFLGSDGSDVPPLETADGQYICFVDAARVKRK